MGKVLMCGTSGGVTSDDVTAKRADVLAGKKTITADSNDEIVEGTFPNRGHYMATPTNAIGSVMDSNTAGIALFMEQGAYYEKPNGDSIEKPFVVAKWDKVRGAVGATDPAKWRSNATIAGRAGTMPEQGGSTIVPGTSNKTAVAANRFVNGNIIVSGDPNLQPGNIRDGVTIFGTRGNVVEYKTPSVITDYSGTITGKDPDQGSSGQWEDSTSARVLMRLYQGAWIVGRLLSGLNLTGWNYIDFYASVDNYTSEAYFGISQNPNLSSINFTNMVKLTPGNSRQVKMNVSANNGVWYFYIGAKHLNSVNAGRTNGPGARDIKLMTQ